MDQLTQSSLTNKAKQLRQIKQICCQGREVNNMELRSMLTSIAYNLQALFENQIKRKSNQVKQNNTKDEQNTKKQYNAVQIQSELNNITETMIKKISLLDQKIQKISDNVFNQLERQRKLNQQIISKNQQSINKKVEDYNQKINNQLKNQQQRLQREILNLKKKIDQLKPQLKSLHKNQGKQIMKEKEQSKIYQLAKLQINAEKWVDEQFCQRKNLVFQNNKITALGWTDIYGKNQGNTSFQFTILINRLENKKMVIGVIDNSLKQKIKSSNHPNQIYYHSLGTFWDGNQIKNIVGFNKGYKEGETMTVKVDLKSGLIQWKVDDQVRCAIKCQKLKNSDINWVPFIFLSKKGDNISILQ